MIFMEFKSLKHFAKASCKKHPCKVSINFAKWFNRSCLKKLLTHTDGRTVRQWTMGHYKSSPRGQCPQVN